ncbi:MAG: hypothetical protein WCU00_05510 [Candidatus Latescibacterota bacterium]
MNERRDSIEDILFLLHEWWNDPCIKIVYRFTIGGDWLHRSV